MASECPFSSVPHIPGPLLVDGNCVPLSLGHATLDFKRALDSINKDGDVPSCVLSNERSLSVCAKAMGVDLVEYPKIC
eukprot:12400113-Karenia_brevis.AAC.1